MYENRTIEYASSIRLDIGSTNDTKKNAGCRTQDEEGAVQVDQPRT